MTVALAAIFALRERDDHAAGHLASKYEEIAVQHTRGLLGQHATVVALARLTDELGDFENDSQAHLA
jgi:hypothetical protein